MEREVTGYPGLSVEEDSVDDLCLSSEDDKKRITGVILGEEREREYMYVYIFVIQARGRWSLVLVLLWQQEHSLGERFK